MRRNIYSYIPWGQSFYLIVIIFFALLLPLLFIFFANTVISSFNRLGFSVFSGLAIFILTLLGSSVNIPIKTIVSKTPFYKEKFVSFFGINYRVPAFATQDTIVAINLGGAVIPMLVSIFQLTRLLILHNAWSFFASIIATIIVSNIIHLFAKPVEGLGIAIPLFIPPIVTVIVTLLLNPAFHAPVAYISGTLGTLIGADLMNLKRVNELGAPIVSIGGAGTFDGIFLTGIISVILV